MSKRYWPVRSFDQVIIDRALVVAVVQSGGASEREEAAVVHTVNNRLGHDLDIVSSGFGEERPAAGSFLWQRSHHLVSTRWVLAEEGGMFPFYGIQDRYLVVPLFLRIGILDEFAVIRADRNQRGRPVKGTQGEGHC